MATGFTRQLSGERVNIQLNDYDTASAYDYLSNAGVFVFDGEIAAAKWLAENKKNNIPVYAGRIEGGKMVEQGVNSIKLFMGIKVNKNSHLYLDHTNKHFDKILVGNRYISTDSLSLGMYNGVYCSDDALVLRTQHIKAEKKSQL